MIQSFRHKGLERFFVTGSKKGILPEHSEAVMKHLRKPVHPGKVFLLDVLVPLGLSVTNAANCMGITRKTLSELVNERASCSPQMALRIAAVTRTSAESWLAMQAKLDLWKARQKKLGLLRQLVNA